LAVTEVAADEPRRRAFVDRLPVSLRTAPPPIRWLWMRRTHERAPLVLLGAVSVFSLGARLWWINKPLVSGGKSALIFDEQYYVNAARVILGIHGNSAYGDAAFFHDPNAEHPPLAKLLIALSMKVLGDNAWGWRIFPVIFGSLALLAMFWLVRSAGGSRWLALGASFLFAVDNLMLLQGRIALLDIFTVFFMLVSVALYLRRRAVLAGIALGIGLCTKLTALDIFFVLLLIESARVVFRRPDDMRRFLRRVRERVVPLAKFTGVAAITYVALLYALDLIASPIGGPGSCATAPAGFHNPIEHTNFMLCYAGKLTNPTGPTGIASYPWQWLLNEVSINYYTVNTTVSANGHVIGTYPIVAFQGEMNPAIIFLALPAFALAVRDVVVQRDTLSTTSVAWMLGTFLPFVVAAAPFGSIGNRTSYLYYMVVVLPGIFLGVAQLASNRRLPPAMLFGYVCILGYWFVTLYPFRTWGGG
jgi:dolichyl-phosphate-mannose--protein O-mannosyl transferase